MDPNDIFKYAINGIKWLAAGGGIYITTFLGLNVISNLFSERIRNQEDLDRIIAEEAKKLGMTRQVTSKFHNTYEAVARKLEDETYKIDIGGSGANRGDVRHELYHVHRGHCDDRKKIENDFLNELDYLFRREPQAVAYQVFRLKL